MENRDRRRPAPARKECVSDETKVRGGDALAAAALLVLPAGASADSLEAAGNGVLGQSVAINSLWVIVAGLLVMFMQAGFAFLEIGFSRGKNAGTIVAKILVNFSIAALAWYASGSPSRSGPGRSSVIPGSSSRASAIP